MIVPLLGAWIDRHGGRGVLVLGVLMEGAGLLLSGLVQSFWQFVLVRCSLVSILPQAAKNVFTQPARIILPASIAFA